MTARVAIQVLAATLLLSGAGLTLLAAVGLLRLPDVLARLQATTKPQVAGLLLIIAGVGLEVGDPAESLALVLVWVFQLTTAPVLAQLAGRAAYHTGVARRHTLVIDELADALRTRQPEDD